MAGGRFREVPGSGLERIYAYLDHISDTQDDIMSALTDLQAAVAAEETEEGAILVYLQGIPTLIQDAIAQAGVSNQQTNVALAALSQQIASDTQKLATGLSVAPTDPGPVSTSASTSVSSSVVGVSSSLASVSTSTVGVSSSLSTTGA